METKMKTLKEYVNENALKAGQKDTAIKDSVKYLSKELRKLFPEEEWNIEVASSTRNDRVNLRFSYKPSSSAQNTIRRNRSMFMVFAMMLTGRAGNEEDLPTVTWEPMASNIDIGTFKNISSNKSTKDANQKLVAWFKENRKTIYTRQGLKESLDENLNESITNSHMSAEVFDANVDRVGQTAVNGAGKELKDSLVISSNIIAAKQSGKVKLHITDMFRRPKDTFEITLFDDELKVLKKIL